MHHRYSPLLRLSKKIYRHFFPVPGSPWTAGEVGDICAVDLVPPATLVPFFENCIELLRKAKGDSVGDYLEFGVFNGNSMGCMHTARQKRNMPDMRLFGFDAFEGLPAGAEDEDGGVWQKGFYACSFEDMCGCLARRGIDSGDIHWVRGWYDQTLTKKTAQDLGLKNIGIVFIDCDTYLSARAVLDFIAPLVTSPVIMCLDDWKLNDLDLKEMGEYRAFNEFLEASPHLTAREIKSYNRKSKSFWVAPV